MVACLVVFVVVVVERGCWKKASRLPKSLTVPPGSSVHPFLWNSGHCVGRETCSGGEAPFQDGMKGESCWPRWSQPWLECLITGPYVISFARRLLGLKCLDGDVSKNVRRDRLMGLKHDCLIRCFQGPTVKFDCHAVT